LDYCRRIKITDNLNNPAQGCNIQLYNGNCELIRSYFTDSTGCIDITDISNDIDYGIIQYLGYPKLLIQFKKHKFNGVACEYHVKLLENRHFYISNEVVGFRVILVDKRSMVLQKNDNEIVFQKKHLL